jgi:hypothetical protein
MTESNLISFRVPPAILEWIKSQAEEGESPSKTVQRLLGLFAEQTSPLPTSPVPIDVNAVNNVVNSQLAPLIERMATIEERLGKLTA